MAKYKAGDKVKVWDSSARSGDGWAWFGTVTEVHPRKGTVVVEREEGFAEPETVTVDRLEHEED